MLQGVKIADGPQKDSIYCIDLQSAWHGKSSSQVSQTFVPGGPWDDSHSLRRLYETWHSLKLTRRSRRRLLGRFSKCQVSTGCLTMCIGVPPQRHPSTADLSRRPLRCEACAASYRDERRQCGSSIVSSRRIEMIMGTCSSVTTARP